MHKKKSIGIKILALMCHYMIMKLTNSVLVVQMRRRQYEFRNIDLNFSGI